MFSTHSLVPWQLSNRWNNCKYFCQRMHFRVSHIYREGNSYAYKIANFGVSSHDFTWWDLIPDFIREGFSEIE